MESKKRQTGSNGIRHRHRFSVKCCSKKLIYIESEWILVLLLCICTCASIDPTIMLNDWKSKQTWKITDTHRTSTIKRFTTEKKQRATSLCFQCEHIRITLAVYKYFSFFFFLSSIYVHSIQYPFNLLAPMYPGTST